jgi:hypothetical protein
MMKNAYCSAGYFSMVRSDRWLVSGASDVDVKYRRILSNVAELFFWFSALFSAPHGARNHTRHVV